MLSVLKTLDTIFAVIYKVGLIQLTSHYYGLERGISNSEINSLIIRLSIFVIHQ